MAHQSVETAFNIILDSRLRRKTEKINDIYHSFNPPIRNCTVIRLSDIVLQRTQYILTEKTLHFKEITSSSATPGAVVEELTADEVTEANRQQEILNHPNSICNIAVANCDASAHDLIGGLAALMNRASDNHWVYAVDESGGISVTDPTGVTPNPTFILEPTQDPNVVTEEEFRKRMASSLLYELGYDLSKIFSGKSSYASSYPLRSRGDESVYVRLFVNGLERGDLMFATNNETSITCFGRLTLSTSHMGTAYCMGLPWLAPLDCETISGFRIQFCRLTPFGLEPYSTRGQDYSGMMQIYTNIKKMK